MSTFRADSTSSPGSLGDLRRWVAVAVAAMLAAGVAVAAGLGSSLDAGFWSDVRRSGSLAYVYEDAGAMQEDSHVVVLGRVIDVERGRSPAHYEDGRLVVESGTGARSTLLTISVSEVLDGTGSSVSDGSIGNVEIAQLRYDESALPSEEAVFFLRDQERVAEELGRPEEGRERARGFFLLTHPHGIQIEQDGRVVAALDPPSDDPEGYRHLTDASSLPELAQQIRERAPST